MFSSHVLSTSHLSFTISFLLSKFALSFSILLFVKVFSGSRISTISSLFSATIFSLLLIVSSYPSSWTNSASLSETSINSNSLTFCFSMVFISSNSSNLALPSFKSNNSNSLTFCFSMVFIYSNSSADSILDLSSYELVSADSILDLSSYELLSAVSILDLSSYEL